MTAAKRAARYGIWIGVGLAVLALPTIFRSGFALTLLNQMGVAVVFALAYNMLLGQGGMLSFGHAIYFGLAGFFCVQLLAAMSRGALPYVPISLMPFAGGLFGLVAGLVIGFVSTRRSGMIFAMISLGFAELVSALILLAPGLFYGRTGGHFDRWFGPEPFGINFNSQIQVFYLITLWVFIAMGAMYALTRTPFGRLANAVRDNPDRVAYLGYNPQRLRWLGFTLSAFFAGLAGALHAINYEFVGLSSVGAQQSSMVLVMTYIGGIGHFLGPVIGAVLITLLHGALGELTQAWYLYLGLLFVGMVMFVPGGIAGLIMVHEPIWRTGPGRLRVLAAPYGAAAATTLIAAAGAIGIVELIHFTSAHRFGTTVYSFFGIVVDAMRPLPWLLCGALLAVGAFGCRRTYPGVARGWAAAMPTTEAGKHCVR